ncbi:hypothetical protein JB92DRAFT_1820534 [Gautieria morchelliformis]|nr:hypothetical protein JB92DRAFT_1820534 [Gautieria morchelliformis]
MDAFDAHHGEAIGSPSYPNPHDNLGIRPVPTQSSWDTWRTYASHPLQKPQNFWSQRSNEQNTACQNQAQQRYLVVAQQHVSIPTQPMTSANSATAQSSLPVNSTEFHYERTSEANSYLPLSQDSVQRYTELAEINWAPLSSYGNEATAHSQNQTGSKHPQVVVGVQNQSIPNYLPNNYSHDDGHACDTTFVHQP